VRAHSDQARITPASTISVRESRERAVVRPTRRASSSARSANRSTTCARSGRASSCARPPAVGRPHGAQVVVERREAGVDHEAVAHRQQREAARAQILDGVAAAAGQIAHRDQIDAAADLRIDGCQQLAGDGRIARQQPRPGTAGRAELEHARAQPGQQAHGMFERRRPTDQRAAGARDHRPPAQPGQRAGAGAQEVGADHALPRPEQRVPSVGEPIQELDHGHGAASSQPAGVRRTRPAASCAARNASISAGEKRTWLRQSIHSIMSAGVSAYPARAAAIAARTQSASLLISANSCWLDSSGCARGLPPTGPS
jgi:hypothetical protein